jgi:hypothetical protein
MDISNLTESLLKALLKTVINASSDVIEPVHKDKSILEFTNISDFWKKRDFREGDYVQIDGVLSQFAPTMFGGPKSKRDLHRATRRYVLDKIPSDSENVTQFDALLAYTAGQMVIRPSFPKLPYVFMGLYHSIVRNSIPVFVNADYYSNHVLPFFRNGITAVEVSILGRFNDTETGFIKGFLDEFKLSEVYGRDLIEGRLSQQNYSIQINGNIDSTYIKYKEPARYLDGDIWIVTRLGGKDSIVSRFLDLADTDDLKQERTLLRRDVEENFKNSEIISEYDQIDRIFDKKLIIDPEDLAREFLSRTPLKDPNRQIKMTEKRLSLIQSLSRLPETQFGQLVFALAPPSGNVPPASAPLSQRVQALLEWAESPIGCGLEQVSDILSKFLS